MRREEVAGSKVQKQKEMDRRRNQQKERGERRGAQLIEKEWRREDCRGGGHRIAREEEEGKAGRIQGGGGGRKEGVQGGERGADAGRDIKGECGDAPCRLSYQKLPVAPINN